MLQQIALLVPQANLSPEARTEIEDDLAKVQAEAAKPEPNRGILLKRLGSLVEFLANTATVITATPQLLEMGKQALEWAKALF